MVNALLSFHAFINCALDEPGTPITVNFPQSDAFAMQSNLHEVYGYLNSSQLINHDAWTNEMRNPRVGHGLATGTGADAMDEGWKICDLELGMLVGEGLSWYWYALMCFIYWRITNSSD